MRIVLLLLCACLGFAADPPVNIGLGPAPAISSVFPSGVPANTQVAVSNGSGLIGSAGFTSDTSGDITAANVTVSALTATYVAYAGAAGLLTSSSHMTFDGNSLSVNGNVNSQSNFQAIGSSSQFKAANGTAGDPGVDVVATSTTNNAILIDSAAGSAQVGMQFDDFGSAEWTIYKGTTNTLNIYDLVDSHNFISFAQGTLSTGVISIPLTTVASSSSTGALTVSGGEGIAGALFVGGGETVTGNLVADGSSGLNIAQSAAAGGTRQALTVTAATNLSISSGVDAPVVLMNPATRTWATSTPSSTREWKLGADTIACDTVSQTVTDAATLDIVGGPIQGTNVTITYSDAIRIEAGYLKMVGTAGNTLAISNPVADGSVACVFTATQGPTGAQTAIQGWMRVNMNGTDRYIPFW